jgi:hypothetical protein
MNNPDSPFSVALQLLTLMMIVGIFIVLVNFTRSPVLITTISEADEIVQIERLEREVQALKRRVGAQ